MSEEKKIEIFLENYKDAIEKTIEQSFEIECKRIKKLAIQNKSLIEDITRCEEYADRLNKENKELKKQLEFSRTHKSVLDAERIKYKQALVEIREMLETCLKFTTCKKCKFYKKCDKDIEECIITMINEVLNEQ